jgi:hypothetical protein
VRSDGGKEALTLWQRQGPEEIYQDSESKEQIQFWDADEIETLDSYPGKVRVIRAVVTPSDHPTRLPILGALPSSVAPAVCPGEPR